MFWDVRILWKAFLAIWTFDISIIAIIAFWPAVHTIYRRRDDIDILTSLVCTAPEDDRSEMNLWLHRLAFVYKIRFISSSFVLLLLWDSTVFIPQSNKHGDGMNQQRWPLESPNWMPQDIIHFRMHAHKGTPFWFTTSLTLNLTLFRRSFTLKSNYYCRVFIEISLWFLINAIALSALDDAICSELLLNDESTHILVNNKFIHIHTCSTQGEEVTGW